MCRFGKIPRCPIHHKRVTRGTYDYILGKMDKRLSSWKANSLSSAARHTLVQSVISVIPSYEMQRLQASTCHEIDKRYRSFLWG